MQLRLWFPSISHVDPFVMDTWHWRFSVWRRWCCVALYTLLRNGLNCCQGFFFGLGESHHLGWLSDTVQVRANFGMELQYLSWNPTEEAGISYKARGAACQAFFLPCITLKTAAAPVRKVWRNKISQWPSPAQHFCSYTKKSIHLSW